MNWKYSRAGVMRMYRAARKIFNFTIGFMVVLTALTIVVGMISGNTELFQMIPFTVSGIIFASMCKGDLKRIERKRGEYHNYKLRR